MGKNTIPEIDEKVDFGSYFEDWYDLFPKTRPKKGDNILNQFDSDKIELLKKARDEARDNSNKIILKKNIVLKNLNNTNTYGSDSNNIKILNKSRSSRSKSRSSRSRSRNSRSRSSRKSPYQLSRNSILIEGGYNIKSNRKITKRKTKIIKGGGKTTSTWENIIWRLLPNPRPTAIFIHPGSDIFNKDNPNALYAGIIHWITCTNNNGNINCEKKLKHRPELPSIRILIQNTANWRESDFGTTGQGLVHSYLYKQLTGINVNHLDAIDCCSGFSILYDEQVGWYVKYSSILLNASNRTTSPYLTNCYSNGNKSMNIGEIFLTNQAVKLWLEKYNGSSDVKMPNAIGITDFFKLRQSIEMKNDSWCDLDYVRTFGYDSFINNIGNYGNIGGPIV